MIIWALFEKMASFQIKLSSRTLCLNNIGLYITYKRKFSNFIVLESFLCDFY